MALTTCADSCFFYKLLFFNKDQRGQPELLLRFKGVVSSSIALNLVLYFIKRSIWV